MSHQDKIYVAGHRGLVGSAIVRRLQREGFTNIITRTHSELDLMDKAKVDEFFAQEKPDYVFMAAAKVGGIQANLEALDQFMYVNTMIEFNTIMAAFEHGVKKFCFLGSGCIYPRICPQPIKESYLLTAPLEITNEGYALAKITGLKLCEYLNTNYPDRADFISVMPCNLYGPGDNYHPEHSHVIPGLLRKFHEAKTTGKNEVIMWGTGSAKREFLHIDDMADACVFLMQNYSGDPGKDGYPGESWVNVGCGEDMPISELGKKIADVVGFEGTITYDHVHPDGTPTFAEGLRTTYEDYKIHKDDYRK